MLSKNVNNKNCAILQWKINQKDSDDFWRRKLTLKFSFGTFWHLPITPICKIQWFPLTAVDLETKNFLILYTSLENSTTGIDLMKIFLFYASLNICIWISWLRCPFSLLTQKFYLHLLFIFLLKFSWLGRN